MARKKVNKIEKFIKDNKLDFTGSDSDLNGNCVILAGYACYLGLNWSAFDTLVAEFDSSSTVFNIGALLEMERVFDYAYRNNYGEYWKTAGAKSTYIF